VVAVGRVAHLAALGFTRSRIAAEASIRYFSVFADFVEVHQDQLAQVAVEQGARGHEALAAAFIDAVGDGQEGLDLRDAAGHGVGEEHVGAVRDQLVDLGHGVGADR
jgi:hypothetical protein